MLTKDGENGLMPKSAVTTGKKLIQLKLTLRFRFRFKMMYFT